MSTSRLERALGGLQTRIAALYPNVSFRLGARFIAGQEDAPPRIVWVRATDAFEPAQRTSPRETAVLTRAAVLVAHCWASAGDSYDTDDAAVEALVDALACALRDEFGASALPTDAEWIDPPSATGGLACLVAFTLRVPVVRPEVPVAQATTTAFDASGASPADGVLDAGE